MECATPGDELGVVLWVTTDILPDDDGIIPSLDCLTIFFPESSLIQGPIGSIRGDVLVDVLDRRCDE